MSNEFLEFKVLLSNLVYFDEILTKFEPKSTVQRKF